MRDFLIDCQTVTEAEVHSFASSIRENNELIDSLILVFEDKQYHKEFLEPLCEQLFAFFRAQEEPLRQFAMFFLPCIVGVYLSSVHRGDRKAVRCIELLLLGAYNLQVLDSEGKPTVTTCTIPSISKPSIYHEPIAMPQAQLTENALSKLEHGDNKITQGPYFTIESLNASNRLHVALVLIRVYNQNISIMPQCSRASLCKMCSRLVNQGSAQANRRAPFEGPAHSTFMPKIFLTSQFLLELLQAIYFSMFNGLYSLGHQALSDVHRRAMQGMYTDVLLVTNAIKNSLESHPSGHPADGPMGISIAISPTTSTTTVSKAIITNASFRTKKLPDDIPIPKEGESGTHEGQQGLDAIREEGAAQSDDHTSSKEPGSSAQGPAQGPAQGAAQAVKAMLPSMPRIIPGVSKVVKAITKREEVRAHPADVPIPLEEESAEVALAVANPFVDLQITKRNVEGKLSQPSTEMDSGRKSSMERVTVDHTSYAETKSGRDKEGSVASTPNGGVSKETSTMKRGRAEEKKDSGTGSGSKRGSSTKGSATPLSKKESRAASAVVTPKESTVTSTKKGSNPFDKTEASAPSSRKESDKKEGSVPSSKRESVAASGTVSPDKKRSSAGSTEGGSAAASGTPTPKKGAEGQPKSLSAEKKKTDSSSKTEAAERSYEGRAPGNAEVPTPSVPSNGARKGSTHAESHEAVPNGVGQPELSENSSKHDTVNSSMLEQLATADHTTSVSVAAKKEKPRK